MQTPGLHEVPFIHCPLAVQVCGVLPLHCWLFGTQAPPQTPLLQTNAQAAPLLAHCPIELQSCG
jgi:hypothetical protein